MSFSPFTGALRTGGADGPGAAVVAQGFLDTVGPLPSGLPAANETALSAAATLMITAIRTDGVVQAFGAGHSEAVAMEIAGRAGGLCRPTGWRCGTSWCSTTELRTGTPYSHCPTAARCAPSPRSPPRC